MFEIEFSPESLDDLIALASIQGWESFEIDEDNDITKNKKLMKHLASRRSGSKAISLSEVKNRLGLS